MIRLVNSILGSGVFNVSFKWKIGVIVKTIIDLGCT